PREERGARCHSRYRQQISRLRHRARKEIIPPREEPVDYPLHRKFQPSGRSRLVLGRLQERSNWKRFQPYAAQYGRGLSRRKRFTPRKSTVVASLCRKLHRKIDPFRKTVFDKVSDKG